MLDYVDEMIKAIVVARKEAEEDRHGPYVDLCNILLKIVKEFEAKGIDYIVKYYWSWNPDREIANWRNELLNS
jgi:hypothetical protein